MKPGIAPITVAIVLAALSLVVAQSVPSAPRNLRIITDAPTTPAPLATGRGNAYFDSLVTRREHAASWSLRDQGQLDSLTATKASTFFTYQYGADPHPEAQDGAKFYVPAGRESASIPIRQELMMTLPNLLSGSMLITWDWYWGAEFRANRGGMNHYKMFHVMLGGHGWWTLMHSPAWGSGDEAAKAWDSFFGGQAEGAAPNGLVRREPYHPAGAGTPNQTDRSTQYPQYHSRWMRYWIEIKAFQPPNAFTDWNEAYGVTLQPHPNDDQGRWHMVSLWSADENRDVQRLVYRVPVGWRSSWIPSSWRFDFEMNTSQRSGFIGPWIGYARNVVVLHNYQLPVVPETDTFIFQRPVK